MLRKSFKSSSDLSVFLSSAFLDMNSVLMTNDYVANDRGFFFLPVEIMTIVYIKQNQVGRRWGGGGGGYGEKT